MGLIGRLKRKYCGPKPSTKAKTGGPKSLKAMTDYYIEKWSKTYIPPNRKTPLTVRLQNIIQFEGDYKILAEASLIKLNFYIPWYVIAGLHYREFNNRFTGHMHNGDPLTARTKHVPKGRPKTGNPPFTFEESFLDAMEKMKTSQITKWNIPAILWFCERYNGFGYYNRGIASPYVFSYTSVYTGGMYTKDGYKGFDYDKMDPRPGVGAFLKLMLQENMIKLLE